MDFLKKINDFAADDKNLCKRFIRQLIPDLIRKPISNKIYWLLNWCDCTISNIGTLEEQWKKKYSYLSINSLQLTWWQKIQYQILSIIMYLSEKRFLKKYRNFAHALQVTPPSPLKGHGLLCMISTLGPGGAERQAVLTLTKLKKLNLFPVSLLTFFLKTEAERFFLSQIEEANISCEEIDYEGKHQTQHLEEAYSAAQHLPNELRSDVLACIRSINSRRPEIVHSRLDEINIKSGLAAVTLGIPKIILDTRSLPPFHFAFYQPYMREGYRWLIKQPGVTLINLSEAGARAYEKWLGLARGSIKVIYNGFDFDQDRLREDSDKRLAYRSKHNIPTDAAVVGTIIRLSNEKRPLLWVEVAQHIKVAIPEIHFLMAGDGPLLSQVKRRIDEMDLSSSFHLVGIEEEALAAITAMDVFLLTSRIEGLGSVLIEAQAMGIPVVTTNAGGTKETFRHSVTGWLVDSHKAADIAQRVIKTLKDEDWRKKASPLAMEFIQERFSAHRMLKETLALYQN